ncbi:uncharacterized protein LOC133493802 isoform X3 [Syngnathoides biaculeatus]|uniref:uncharacterized protein LOC133493802 isoform X3 n=1 Tax=Syngnathoides biaculeatus TaxID=300417 RepID=UPI002ADE2AAC|nr:uncharacterized protein LOC133493802 isoform X3 [Syngnathoides biaculeatus]
MDRRKCCDHRVKMCARTTGEYKEEVRGPKKEEKPQHQLLDAVFTLQPPIVLRRADQWSKPRGQKIEPVAVPQIVFVNPKLVRKKRPANIDRLQKHSSPTRRY